MADKKGGKDNTYGKGSITQKADTDRKSQTAGMMDMGKFNKDMKNMGDRVKAQLGETKEDVEGAQGFKSVESKLNSVLSDLGKNMSGMMGQNALNNRKLLEALKGKSMGKGKDKGMGVGGINPKEIAGLLAKVAPALQKGGFVSKTGLAKIHAGEGVFPKGSMDELVSLMKEQSYYMKQISGYFDEAKIPDMLKMDEKTFGEMVGDWITGGLKKTFPTFIKIGKFVGKPIYKLFKLRGGTYVYATQLSKAESPFRQISENIGVLYTGSMLRMDRMLAFQKATAEAVRDLSTHVTGHTYSAIEDIKPSKKFRLIGQVAKGIGKGILGLGGGFLGGAAGLAMGGPLGAIAGALGGGALGFKKGAGFLAGVGNLAARRRAGGGFIAEETKEKYRKKLEEFKRMKEKAGTLAATRRMIFGRKEKERNQLLGKTYKPGLGIGGNVRCIPVEICSSSVKKLSQDTARRPLVIKFANVKSKFAKKNKEGVIDVALTPEAQKALDSVKDSSSEVAKIEEEKKKDSKGGIWGWIKTIFKVFPLIFGFLGKVKDWVLGFLKDTVWSWVKDTGGGFLKNIGTGGLKYGKDLLTFFTKTPLSKAFGTFSGALGAITGIAGAGIAGWEIGTWINDNVITPYFDAKEKRDHKEATQLSAKADKKQASDIAKLAVARKNGGAVTTDIYKTALETKTEAMLGGKNQGDIAGLTGEDPASLALMGASMKKYRDDHLGEYLAYSPFELNRLRLEYNDTEGQNFKRGAFQDAKELGMIREASFLAYLKTHGKKQTPEEAAAQEAKYKAGVREWAEPSKSSMATPNSTPPVNPADQTEALIKNAKETAAQSLISNYGLSAADARKYVEEAAKVMDKDTHSLTDPSILTKNALAYMDQEGITPGEKPKNAAPSDYGKAAAIAEATNTMMTSDAVQKGVEEGMKPALAEQTKALSSAITASSSNATAQNNSTRIANSTSNASSNYVYPGVKDPWSESAQRGMIPR